MALVLLLGLPLQSVNSEALVPICALMDRNFHMCFSKDRMMKVDIVNKTFFKGMKSDTNDICIESVLWVMQRCVQITSF